MPKSTKRRRKSPPPLWKDMQRFRELDYFVSVHLQDRLNVNYLNGTNDGNLKFEGLDQKVICLANGLFYSASTQYYYRLTIPSTLYPVGTDVPYPKRVMTYLLKLTGWADPVNQEEIAENEIISCRLDDPVAVVGMLTAHCWNVWKQNETGLSQKNMGPGVWFLDAEEYAQLEDLWRENSKEKVTFVEFIRESYAKYFKKTLENSPDISATSSTFIDVTSGSDSPDNTLTSREVQVKDVCV